MSSRYVDRLDTIKRLEREVITLQHLLGNHSRQLTLSGVLNIHKSYTSVKLGIDAVENWIVNDAKANWITSEEYEHLVNRLEDVKGTLKLLV